MENLSLNEHELKYFAELFGLCDVENSGKITGPSASDLFIKSGLQHEILLEIINICGAKRLGHFGRSQFYIALKLIAAVQHGFPVQLESLRAGRDVSLPRFARKSQDVGRQLSATHPQPAQAAQPVYANRLPHTYDQTQGISVNVSAQNSSASNHSNNKSPSVSPKVESAQPVLPVSKNNATNVLNVTHPQASSNMKQTGVANNSLSGYVSVEKSSRMQPRNVEKVWASFDDDNQGLISEDKKEWMHFTDSSKADTSSLSSEAESVEDIWSISEELRTYYLNQFITMQPDIKGVILGSVAKEFFEKSKLPTSQLSKIWQLSDVNKDGALNLEEFNTAMHLVVCRINGMELPDQLPHSLQPYVPFTNSDEPFACDLPPGSTLKRLTPSSPGKPQPPPFTQPSPSSSSVSSPGQKPTPVNFEFRPITEDQDSMIAHPVALRMSPDGQAFPLDNNGKPIAHAPTQPEDAVSGDAAQAEIETNPYAVAHLAHLQGRPRPTPKKAQSVPASGQESDMLSPSFPPPPPISSQDTAAAAMDVPVPPPRVKTHSRSSSLDADQVLQSPDTGYPVDGAPISPPVVPPRPKEGCSSNEMSSSTLSASVTSPSDDKAVTPQHSGDELNAASKVLPKLDSQQTKDLRQRIKEQKEKNLTLSRLNVELNSELQEVMEQRIALEIQMEHLRPYGAGY